jgi:hypothetical protein
VTVPCIPHPRTAAALQARRQAAADALEPVQEAIGRLRRDKTPVTVAGVARRARLTNLLLRQQRGQSGHRRSDPG